MRVFPDKRAQRIAAWIVPPVAVIAVAVIVGAAVGQTATKPGTGDGTGGSPPVKPAEPPPRTTHVVGHSGNVWVVRVPAGKRDEFELLHRAGDDKPEMIYKAMPGKGELTHVAAWGSTLWCLYSDRSVQAIRYRAADRSMPRSIETVQQPPLTDEGEVIGWAAGAAGPVALIRRPEAPDEPAGDADEAGEPAPAQDPAPIDPADTDARGDDKPVDAAGEASGEAPDAPETTEEPTPEPTPVDLPPPGPIRLLQLDTTGWRDVSLPRSMRPDMLVGLVMRSGDSYVLVSDHRPAMRAFTAHVYRNGSWSDHTFAMELSRDLQLVGVEGDLFAVSPYPDRRWQLKPQYLYPGAARGLNTINLRPKMTRWWAFPGDGSIMVVDIDADGTLAWTKRGTNESTYVPSAMTEMTVSDPPPLLPQPMTIVMIAALVIGMLFMLGGTRREPAKVVLVPRGTRPAGSIRIVAAVIDLAPAVGASMLVHRIANPVELFTRWADHPDEWRQMAPWLLVVGVFVLHTTVTELFTGATLGKLLLNLRVIGMDGRAPHVWQVLGRNAFKAIELLPPFVLLLLPVLNRYHQRLGDMVARTLVIGPDPDAERRRKEEEDELFRDDDEDYY